MNNYTAYNYPLDANETISDSLLDKFNNLSSTTSIGDRIIRKINIIKDQLSSTSYLDTVSSEKTVLPTITTAVVEEKDVGPSKCSTLKKTKSSETLSRGKKLSWFSTLGRSSPKSKKTKKEAVVVSPPSSPTQHFVEIPNSFNLNLSGYTLGISIIQGTDNNVYVKDLVKYGPGEKSGIQIGDQVCCLVFFSLVIH